MSPERVIPGQVVPVDSADDADDADGAPGRPQETFLHKVASVPFSAGPRTRTGDDGSASAEADTEVFTMSGAVKAEAADADEVDAAEVDQPDAEPADADVSVVDAVVVEAGEPGPADADSAQADAADADAAQAGAADADAADAGVADDGPRATTDMPTAQAGDGRVPDRDEPLLGEAAGRIREEWRQVQASFVDDPRASTAAAAGLAADAAARLESLLRERQRALLSARGRPTAGQQSARAGDGRADTETLRQLMLAYRKLLTKLIS
jgi:hypothetical protein